MSTIFFIVFYHQMMKNWLFLILLCPFFCFAQSNRVVDEKGGLLYQYERTYVKNPTNSTELLVTFTFTNGKNQRAISFRQETLETVLRWVDTTDGNPSHEEAVEFVTANLAPNQTVTWKYAVSTRKKTAPAAPEKAAILIMNRDYQVEKIWLE